VTPIEGFFSFSAWAWEWTSTDFEITLQAIDADAWAERAWLPIRTPPTTVSGGP